MIAGPPPLIKNTKKITYDDAMRDGGTLKKYKKYIYIYILLLFALGLFIYVLTV